MRRLLYLDKRSDEIEHILSGKKYVIIRGANIKKYPYKMIDEGDRLYFMNNTSEGIVRASATCVNALFIHEPDPKKRNEMIDSFENQLMLRKDKLNYVRERKYISIFTLSNVKPEYATIDRSLYGVEEDWMRLKPIKK